MISFNELYAFVHEYAVLYHTSSYLVLAFTVFFLLGWFFSTDYYDKIYDKINCSGNDIEAVYMILMIINGVIIASFCMGGLYDDLMLGVSTLVWVIIIIPVCVYKLLQLRKYLRKKRGKL